MKLYQGDLSAFSARVRMQVYAKGLDGREIELAAAPGGTGSAAYKALNPTGKIPALDTGKRVIPESEVICEYIEDVFPGTPLRPADPEARATVRLLSRFVDLYLYPRMSPLYSQLDPATRDEALVSAGLKSLDEAFLICEQLMKAGGYRGGPHAVGGTLTLADCALVPGLFFVNALLPRLGRVPAFAEFETLASYYEAATREPVARRITGEMGAALARMMGAAEA
jgi:glutathione S-transferase